MGQDPLPRADREEPPPVEAMVMRGMTQFEHATRRLIGSINRRVQFFQWGAATVATFVGILVLSIIESPGIVGVLRGILAGLFLALLVAAGVGGLILWGSQAPSKARAREATTDVGELDTLLAPTLRELNVIRADVIRKVKARCVTRIPLGMAGGGAAWLLAQGGDDPPGFLGLLMFVGVGAVLGEVWAAHKLSQEYRRLYKTRVLPQLAGRFGDLTYRQASDAYVQKLREHRIFGDFNKAKAEDEIAGTHRGLPVSIVEAKLEKREGKNTRVVFDGLVVDLTLPRSLTGTTAVVTDAGMIGNLKTRLFSRALERVRLEDPLFEKRYEVYSNDQVEARALLTPAFMQRFTALASLSGFSLPGALADGKRLVVALPKRDSTDLFEPPVYWKPAGGRALAKLDEDIKAVLGMADTVMDLDFWAAGWKKDASRYSQLPTPDSPIST